MIRIAYEIYENNFEEEEVVFAGIWDKGYVLAEILQKQLNDISKLSTSLVKVSLDKFAPTQSEISLNVDPKSLENKVVILVDDVLNSGRTMAYSLKPFLNENIKRIETAVLVNREHTSFPLSATYNGYSLSTTIKEHVEVKIEGSEVEVYLY